MNKSAIKILILVIVVLGMIGGGFFHWLQVRGTERTDDAAIDANIIPIAPKVTGYVIELSVTDNQLVKKDDVILKIDPRDYQVALQQAQADLASAESRVAGAQQNHASTSISAPSNLASAQSEVNAAMAEWKNASITLKRLQSLDNNARSQQSLDDAAAKERTARSNLEAAQSKVKSAQTAPNAIAASEASVKELEAAVLKAKAAVENAQNNLDDTVLKAPEDGRVTRRNVEAGTYVVPGQQLMSLVSKNMWVVANFKETQLSDMKRGQSVDIDIDAYPGKKFTGKIDSIQAGTGARFSLFPPENATGNFVKVVQRVPVKITFDAIPGDEFPLGPGMSVVPIVHVQ